RASGAGLAYESGRVRPRARRFSIAGRLDAMAAIERRPQSGLLPRRFRAGRATSGDHPALSFQHLAPLPMKDRLTALLILCLAIGIPIALTFALTSTVLLSYVFFYPLFMAGIWMAGGLYFWLVWEKRWPWAPGKI